MSVSDTYCVLPFIQLSVGNNGNVNACCLAQGDYKHESGQSLNVGRDDLDSIWKSKAIEDLRAQLLRGEKPETCRRCFTDERLGIESKRQRDNKTWKRHVGLTQASPTPRLLDLRLGNLCNLKCRICSPYSSAKFGKEAAELFDFDFATLQKQTAWAEEEDGLFWRTMDTWLQNVEHFDIYGGEPFLSKPHFALLERSVRQGFSKKQTLHYNTNGTVFPERIAKEVWPKFKAVNVMFSIDGVGAKFEFQRHPANWQEVEENIAKFKKHRYLNLNICFTVNAMNVWDLPEFHAWARKIKLPFWINYLYGPSHFRAQIFSASAKKRIEERLLAMPKDIVYDMQILPLVKFLWDQNFEDGDRQKLIRQLDIYDQKRGESFSSVFPETFELLSMRDSSPQ